ncbi:BnaC09g47380D [Brassica napus]|uniref:ATP-dependent RNA helicase n=1 Tax=Brassica napus TaxID=3708 RepID=A0A078G822_BRANA|nr:BnaC09g47380D [Brassica napus]
MPLKFPLGVRFITHSLPCTHLASSMNSAALIYSFRAVPVISKALPSRLTCLGLCSRVSFSTRPEFGRRGEIRASKSLIEDEAELSDWVSDLRTSSVRGKFTSDEDEAVQERVRRNVERDDGRGPRKGREGQADRFGGSRKVDRFGGSNRSRTGGEPVRNNRFGDREGARNGRIQGRSGESSFRGRNERNVDSGFRRERGMETNKGLGKQTRGLRQEEEDSSDEVVLGGIDDLLSEVSSEDDSEDDEAFVGKVVKGVEADMPRTDTAKTSDSYLSKTRFDQFPLSPLSLRAIKDAGFETMTVVQEATLPIILKGKDVLAKAKTGTGKTVAFLLPSIEAVIKSPPASRDSRQSPIVVLVVCPTRELASQAAAEANTLLKYHPSIGVQVVIGGTKLPTEQRRMQANPCQILVATPGRLKDHIENTSGFATRLNGVKVLVLDEADHLLDMGFRRDIERIIAAVPKQRQTFLFSATVPEEVRQICHIALKRDHEFINCVQEGSGETHQKVKQMYMIASLDRHFSLLYVLLKEHMADNPDYKVIIFCTTAMVTRLVADLLGQLSLNVREIHSRKPQGYRTKVSDEFRKSKSIILVTSDVSARGVDYPDVSLVVQMGLPSDREQYIHRLGRTGRKGKEGEGVLMLAPWEEYFLSSVKDLPINKSPLPPIDPEAVKKVQRGLNQVEMKNKEAAYQAWLGYYKSQKMIARDTTRLVELANEFSRSMGLDMPPAIPKNVLGKMGLKNVPGLRTKLCQCNLFSFLQTLDKSLLDSSLVPNKPKEKLDYPSRPVKVSGAHHSLPPPPLVSMTSDGPKSGKKRREIRAKLAKELASGEDESGNKRTPKRGREDKSADVDEPLIKKAASTVSVEAADNKPKTSDSYLSKTRFDQFPLSPLSLKGIQDAGFKTMTVVQEATLPIILKGKDVLAKAKTGTGKTVAFLLPSIEAVIKSPPVSRDNRHPPIIVLVVCPTRELACQAAAEANILLKYHSSIGVEVVIGGTKLPAEQRRMQKHPCQILVATPGRLIDHIDNTSGFATRLKGVKVLVLDEADHLLDMGFRRDIERIIAAVPKQRQTFLFSATVPEEVRQICHIALKQDHEFVNCVQEGSGETHQKVSQMYMIATLDRHFSLIYALLKKHIADNVGYKVIIFCTTAMVTRLVADLLGQLSLNVREIHSRKPQSYRTRVSDEFRKSKSIILVTSDVSARGVDYPDVSLVVQMGLPSDREQYIHRLGRTGRKGKEGEGVLLLAPWEEYFLSSVKDLPIAKAPLPPIDHEAVKKVQKALSQVEMTHKEAAYQAWLGYYKSQKKIARDTTRLVELANEFSRSMGLDTPPAIPINVIGKMGLKNVPGLRVAPGFDKRKGKKNYRSR